MSSGDTEGSYDLEVSVENWTAFVRQTFPISRSSDLTPAYRQSSKHMQTYLSSVVQDDTQQRVVLHDHLAFLQTTFLNLAGEQELLGDSELFIRDVARALDDLASVK